MSSKRKTREPQEDNVTLGPAVSEGEQVFGVAHIFVSFNDTFIHVADLSGRETLVSITGIGIRCLSCESSRARSWCLYRGLHLLIPCQCICEAFSCGGAMLAYLQGLITAARRNVVSNECTYDQPRQTHLDLYIVAVDGKCEWFQCSYKKRSRLGFGDNQLSGLKRRMAQGSCHLCDVRCRLFSGCFTAASLIVRG